MEMTKGHDITPLFKIIVPMISQSERMGTTEKGKGEERGEGMWRIQLKLRNRREQWELEGHKG